MSESAATIETPAPVTTPETRPPLVLQNGIAGMIASLPGNKKPASKVEEKPPVQKEEKPPVIPPPTEEKKVETPPVVDDKEKNIVALRQARDVASKERDELKAKYEAAQKEVETYKIRPDPTEVEKQRTELEARLANYQKELQAAAIWRDPEFQAKYDGGILSRQKQMIAIAQATGIDASTAQAHVQAWDKTKFNEWVADMPELQKGEFIATIRETESLDRERTQAIANADKTWQQRQEQQNRAQKEAEAQQKKTYSAVAQEVIAELTATEGVAEHEPLVEAIKASVQRALPIGEDHMSIKDVAKHVGMSAMLSHIAQAQHTELAELRTAKEDLEKKVAELEAFVGDRQKSIPGPGNGVGATKTDEPYVPLWKRVRVTA